MEKILDAAAVDQWVAEQRAAGKTIGFTCGTFDILHAGHVQYLEEAKKLCDRLIVAVNSDASVRRYKNPLRPINPQDQRMYVVAGLAAVDVVTCLDEDRPLGLLLRWKPDLYIKGGDYQANGLRSGEAVRQYGGRVEVISPAFASSTSGMLEKIQALALHEAPEAIAGPSRLVMVDRDGTLIRNVPFLHDPERVELLPGVGEGLARFEEHGFKVAIVTNQQGIGLGYYGMDEFIAVNQRMLKEIYKAGGRISRIYFCPHSAADGCECRKPAAGLLRRALKDFHVRPEETYFIGDSEADMEAGRAAGCPTVLTGAHASFEDAVNLILRALL